MGTLHQFLLDAWAYKVSLLPVLITYLIFDFPAIIRRLTKIAYVPIYFTVFPLGHSDKLYAEYLNEDDFYGVGETMSSAEKDVLRRKIQATAVFSMVFAAVLAPWICGLAAAFYLAPNQFGEFLVFFFVTKTFLISMALINLRLESRAADKPPAIISVVGIYVLYLVFVWHGLTKSFKWATSQIADHGYSGFFIALLDYIYTDLLINVAVVAALTWAFTIKFAAPENISKIEHYTDEPAATP